MAFDPDADAQRIEDVVVLDARDPPPVPGSYTRAQRGLDLPMGADAPTSRERLNAVYLTPRKYALYAQALLDARAGVVAGAAEPADSSDESALGDEPVDADEQGATAAPGTRAWDAPIRRPTPRSAQTPDDADDPHATKQSRRTQRRRRRRAQRLRADTAYWKAVPAALVSDTTQHPLAAYAVPSLAEARALLAQRRLPGAAVPAVRTARSGAFEVRVRHLCAGVPMHGVGALVRALATCCAAPPGTVVTQRWYLNPKAPQDAVFTAALVFPVAFAAVAWFEDCCCEAARPQRRHRLILHAAPVCVGHHTLSSHIRAVALACVPADRRERFLARLEFAAPTHPPPPDR